MRAGRPRAATLLRALTAGAVLLAVTAPGAAAHAGLAASSPAAGATVPPGLTAVSLTFQERPEPALSAIRVLDARGADRAAGRPAPATGDPRTLAIGVPALPRGTYTVQWRVVSAIDGHVTAGAYAFGVGVAAPAGRAAATSAQPATSALEVGARWLLLCGLALLVGIAAAGLWRFDGGAGAVLRAGVAAWLSAAAGLALLAVAQRRSAGVPLGDLLDTSVGDALIWRGVALAGCGLALLVALPARGPRARRAALAGVGLGALLGVGVHVAAGHAGAGPWPTALTVGAQLAHVAAAGVWAGGLIALLIGLRGAPSEAGARAVRRFSTVAAGALALLLAAGTLRAVDELAAVSDLVDTGYGRGILAKILLFAAIAALGLRQRRRGVPAAASDLGPLRRVARLEVALAATAFGAAALIGTLAPPQPAAAAARPGLSATGADAAGRVRVELEAAATAPGPNRFRLTARDAAGEPIGGAPVRLRFTPLDDPGVAPTTLGLAGGRNGVYTGAGANLRFDGRWRVRAEVGSAAADLELDVPGPDTFPTITRPPGGPTYISKPVGDLGFVGITLQPERAGRSHVTAGAYEPVKDESRVRGLVLTLQAGDGPVRRLPVRRVSRGIFATDAVLPAGDVHLAVVAHTRDGRRLRATFDVPLSAGS